MEVLNSQETMMWLFMVVLDNISLRMRTIQVRQLLLEMISMWYHTNCKSITSHLLIIPLLKEVHDTIWEMTTTMVFLDMAAATSYWPSIQSSVIMKKQIFLVFMNGKDYTAQEMTKKTVESSLLPSDCKVVWSILSQAQEPFTLTLAHNTTLQEFRIIKQHKIPTSTPHSTSYSM